MPRPYVTTHAVVRWMQRVRGVDFSGLPTDASETVLCYHGLAVLERTLDEVRDEICPPRLWALIRGNGTVRARDRCLLVVDGRIVTCLPPIEREGIKLPREAWAYVTAPTDYAAIAA